MNACHCRYYNSNQDSYYQNFFVHFFHGKILDSNPRLANAASLFIKTSIPITIKTIPINMLKYFRIGPILVMKESAWDKNNPVNKNGIPNPIEYDKSKPIVKVKETDFGKAIPKDEYGFFKYICSKYIEKEKDIVCIRIFGLFGKYEDYCYRFISNAIVNNLKRLSINMNQNVFFDYTYINDFVRIVDYFINHKVKHKFYNIGRGKKIDILTIANKINKISNKKSKITIKNIGLNNEYTCDNSRLANELKKFNFTDFDKSLVELYNWYKNKI